MKQDTKKIILETAKTLFSERGFNAVSIGDISDVLGISKGNLTYHFKKKEAIVEAILNEPVLSEVPKMLDSIESLDAYFTNIQQVIQNNSLYFWHYNQFAQMFPKVHQKQQDIYNNNVAMLQTALINLLNQDLIRKELFKGEYACVIDSLLLAAVYWVPFCGIKQTQDNDNTFKNQAWSILFPLLTDKARKNIAKIRGENK